MDLAVIWVGAGHVKAELKAVAGFQVSRVEHPGVAGDSMLDGVFVRPVDGGADGNQDGIRRVGKVLYLDLNRGGLIGRFV